MSAVPELDDQLHLPGPCDDPPEPHEVDRAPQRGAEVDVDDAEPHEVVDVRSPLTVITWAGGAVAAGLVVMAVVLLLGPLLGPIVLVALTLAIVRRYERSPDGSPEP